MKRSGRYQTEDTPGFTFDRPAFALGDLDDDHLAVECPDCESFGQLELLRLVEDGEDTCDVCQSTFIGFVSRKTP